MVWPFQKRKGVIDFSHLRREIKKDSDIKDFTNNPMSAGSLVSSSNSSSSDDSGLGFFGAIASNSNSDSSGIENLHLKDLKVKIEDVEFKLDSFSKRISSLIDRVDLVEKKIDRNERRGI